MASIAPIALSAEQNTELMPSGGMQHGGAMRDALPLERWNIVHNVVGAALGLTLLDKLARQTAKARPAMPQRTGCLSAGAKEAARGSR